VPEPLRLNRRIVTALEVVGTGVFIEGTGGEQVPDALEHRVGDGDGRLVRAPPASDGGVLGRVVAALGSRCCPGLWVPKTPSAELKRPAGTHG